MVQHPTLKDLDEIEMFRTFKKYDRNMSGVLEFPEYTQCLSEAPGVNISKDEVITMALSADLNGDGRIDFEEFMKHYTDFLDMIEFNSHLSEQYQNVLQAETESITFGITVYFSLKRNKKEKRKSKIL